MRAIMMRYEIGLLAVCMALPCFQLNAVRTHPESYYRDMALEMIGGEVEVVLPNRTRCDILTDEYAVEVDFADKWAGAIGQC
jgi:hypothetical protein